MKKTLWLSAIVLGVLAGSAGSAKALEEGDFWGVARFQLGPKATKQNTALLHKDVTCDGVADFVGGRVNLDNPDRPFYDILVLTDDGGAMRTEAISIPFTGSIEQFGLCGDPTKETAPELSVDEWPEKDVTAEVGEGLCNKPIEVVDGKCDTPRFFWRKEELKVIPLDKARDEPPPRFVFHRN